MTQRQVLNLEWTVGDMDRREFMNRRTHMTVEDIAGALRDTPLQCSVERLRRIADYWGVRLKRTPVAYAGKDPKEKPFPFEVVR